MRKLLLVVVLVAVALAAWRALPTVAQTGNGYDLSWNSIDGGGITFATGANNYSLGGTIGQADAGVLSGGPYTLTGGFWAALNTGGSTYLPLIRR
ncbi:MAG: hypothetical protein E6J26_08160 [Chloroflexi bacterium]|nr:MAG: hypothetical protein E6J26_08160 [Chloroflexota bacterium]